MCVFISSSDERRERFLTFMASERPARVYAQTGGETEANIAFIN